MQASEEKGRDWYGYAKYLEARIERSAQELGALCLQIGVFADQTAKDSAEGKDIYLHFCEALTLIRQMHDSMLNTGLKLKGIAHDGDNKDQRSSDTDGANGLGEMGSEETTAAKEPNSVSGAGRCGSERDSARNDSEGGGSSKGVPRSDDAIPEPLQEVPGGILGD